MAVRVITETRDGDEFEHEFVTANRVQYTNEGDLQVLSARVTGDGNPLTEAIFARGRWTRVQVSEEVAK